MAISRERAGARASEELAIVNRFFEVAETMIELTVMRSPGLTSAEAVAEIKKRSETDLDPDAVSAVERAFAVSHPPRGEEPLDPADAPPGA